jgi:antitoxin ParD1/3/4
MAKNTSISLGDHFANFIDDQIASGRFGSASEVVRAGLRLLEERDMRLKTLREALIEGEESGPAKPFDSAAFLDRMRGKPRAKKRRGKG